MSSRAQPARPDEDLQGADLISDPDDPGMDLDGESPPSTPRWVKGVGISAVVLGLIFVGLHLTGNAPMHTPSPGGAEHGMQAP